MNTTQKQDILVLAGPPGSGKDTQAKLIVEYCKTKGESVGWINSSDVLQARIKDFRERVANGQLFRDDEVVPILTQAITEAVAQGLRFIILTGYPRTLMQSRALVNQLREANLSISLALEFVINENELIARLSSRAKKESRSDDSLATITQRLSIYNSTTRAAIDELSRLGVAVVKIDGVGTQDVVLQRIIKELRGL